MQYQALPVLLTIVSILVPEPFPVGLRRSLVYAYTLPVVSVPDRTRTPLDGYFTGIQSLAILSYSLLYKYPGYKPAEGGRTVLQQVADRAVL